MQVQMVQFQVISSGKGKEVLTVQYSHCWVTWAQTVLKNTLSTSPSKLAVVESKLLNDPSFNRQYASWNIRLILNQYWLLSTCTKKGEVAIIHKVTCINLFPLFTTIHPM